MPVPPKLTPIQQELEDIRKRHHGMLRPVDVVRFAEDKETALHGAFDWDNDEAGHQWRLFQARNLIRTCVTVIPVKGGRKVVSVEVRKYVNLMSDREEAEGYRATVEVLSREQLRTQMLEDALAELLTFRRKYAVLKELARVHAEIDRVAARAGKK